MAEAAEVPELVPMILAGGAGTRLWPLSREGYPKQLLHLAGAHTLLQDTILRVAELAGEVGGAPVSVAAPLVVCGDEMRFLVVEQLQQVGQQPSAVLLEPCARNTAPALTATCVYLRDRGSDPLVLVMPADHVIREPEEFRRRVAESLALAVAGHVVTFGITPERAETGYGYIRRGVSLGPDKRGYAVDAFVEKPDLATAEDYLACGDYFWNAGIFLVRASTWLAAVGEHQPQMREACETAVRGAQRDLDFLRLDANAFAACPSDSIDYAVLEPLSAAGGKLAVAPADIGWSDVGSWSALLEVADADDQGNVIQGDVHAIDSAGSLLISDDRFLAALGVQDLVVISTVDALLVASRERAQDVRQVVGWLREQRREEASQHRRVYRPWGSYEQMDSGERFQVKRLTVKPGAELSLQMHHHRAEHWVVVRGTAQVTKGEEQFLLTENESTYIPLGTVHRLANPGTMALEVIEVQSGSYLGEDDIVRFEDRYNRAKADD